MIHTYLSERRFSMLFLKVSMAEFDGAMANTMFALQADEKRLLTWQ